MKNKWVVAGVLIVVLIGLCGVSLYSVWQGLLMVQENDIRFDIGTDTVSAKETETKDLSVKGPVELTVENDFGEITVQSGADGKVKVQAEKTAWGIDEADAQSALADLKIVIEQDGDMIKISVQQPEEVGIVKFNPRSGSVKFTILVPEETSVTLTSSNADLSLSGTTGNADLQTDFGKVDLHDVNGSIYVRSLNGSVTVGIVDSEEAITLESEFGTITVDTATGADVSVTSNNGQIELRNVDASGRLKIASEFGAIQIHNSSVNSIEVDSNNGSVTAENLDVNGNITVTSEFGDLTFNNVDASSYNLNAQNGKILLDGASGKVTAHSEFGEVEILNAVDATVDLSSNNGSVIFSGSLGAGPHDLSSEFGNIELTIPSETAMDADFQTEFGKITSDFEITLVLQGDVDNKHLQGKINGGGPMLTVKTNNGNIIIQSSD